MRALWFIALALIACSETVDTKLGAPTDGAESGIVAFSDITPEDEVWGKSHVYFYGKTQALDPSLMLHATIIPGQRLHPPHKHDDEQHVVVLTGTGTWYLNGAVSPAKPGDVQFAKSWDYHGLQADDDSEMEILLFKYGARASTPPDPHPEQPKELN